MEINSVQNVEIAKSLDQIDRPFSIISGLPSNSEFYVNVDIARDGKDRRAVRSGKGL